MTTSTEGTAPPIPDFELDARTLAAYDQARIRFARREANAAEAQTRAAFQQKGAALRAEIVAAQALTAERRTAAEAALRAYAARCPKHVNGNRISKPTFWEAVLSFGTAGRLFNAATSTAAEVVQAQAQRRRKEHEEAELEQQLKRALYLQEEANKKRLETPEGLAAFHASPAMANLYKRVVEVHAERARYAARLEKGEVSGAEQRDRDFVQRKIGPIAIPFTGMMIVSVARYVDLTYFILRDLERKEYRLAYDPRLEPLIGRVFDVYRLVDTFEAKLTRATDGVAMTVTDHYAANYPNEASVVRAERRRDREALQVPRADIPATPAADAAEQQLLELLATFARTLVAGETPAQPALEAPPATPPA